MGSRGGRRIRDGVGCGYDKTTLYVCMKLSKENQISKRKEEDKYVVLTISDYVANIKTKWSHLTIDR